MTHTVRDLLRREADGVQVPVIDPDGIVARAGQRRRRRRITTATAAAAVAALVVVGGIVVGGSQDRSQGPVDAPTKRDSGQRTPRPHDVRPLVYAQGTTVHVGDRTVTAEKPVAFIGATDDGAVYEASLDGTLWFTDGITTSVIGRSGFTAAPTAHAGVVTTGDSGSLVVWADVTGRGDHVPLELVVYDTSRRQEVARIPHTRRGVDDLLVHVGEHEVYLTPDSGCWSVDPTMIHPCRHPRLLRFDLSSGTTSEVSPRELFSDMRRSGRTFRTVARDGLEVLGARADLRQVGGRLTAVSPFVRAKGERVRLGLPSGFTALGHKVGASVITTAQWVDDRHVVVWANEGGGDLPPQQGDLLVCELPDGACRVAVPRSAHEYVAP